MYDDLKGYGRRPDEHRMLYDGTGLIQSYDFRSAIDAEEYLVCGYEWTEQNAPLEEWCVGQSVYTYRWDYSPDGHPSSKYYDGGSDGVVDRIWHYEVDSEGRITSESLDQDLDGSIDSQIWYDYNSEGQLIGDRWDYQGDGITDYARSYRYGSTGLLETLSIDSDADGSDDEETTYRYDSWGNILRISTDEAIDGQWDHTAEYAYDNCKLLSISEIELSGSANTVNYSYHDDGRLFREDYDWDANGSRDAFAAWEYVCPL